MNFRNKYLVNTVRIVIGLFFIFSGGSGLYSGVHNMSGVPPAMVPMTQTLWDTGIFQLVKIGEVVGGLMLVVGFLPALGAIFLAPIGIGATVVELRIAPEFVFLPVVASLLLMYLGYAYWDKYKALFRR